MKNFTENNLRGRAGGFGLGNKVAVPSMGANRNGVWHQLFLNTETRILDILNAQGTVIGGVFVSLGEERKSGEEVVAPVLERVIDGKLGPAK